MGDHAGRATHGRTTRVSRLVRGQQGGAAGSERRHRRTASASRPDIGRRLHPCACRRRWRRPAGSPAPMRPPRWPVARRPPSRGRRPDRPAAGAPRDRPDRWTPVTPRLQERRANSRRWQRPVGRSRAPGWPCRAASPPPRAARPSARLLRRGGPASPSAGPEATVSPIPASSSADRLAQRAWWSWLQSATGRPGASCSSSSAVGQPPSWSMDQPSPSSHPCAVPCRRAGGVDGRDGTPGPRIGRAGRPAGHPARPTAAMPRCRCASVMPGIAQVPRGRRQRSVRGPASTSASIRSPAWTTLPPAMAMASTQPRPDAPPSVAMRPTMTRSAGCRASPRDATVSPRTGDAARRRRDRRPARARARRAPWARPGSPPGWRQQPSSVRRHPGSRTPARPGRRRIGTRARPGCPRSIASDGGGQDVRVGVATAGRGHHQSAGAQRRRGPDQRPVHGDRHRDERHRLGGRPPGPAGAADVACAGGPR